MPLGKRVAIIALLCCDPAVAGTVDERTLGLVVALADTKDLHAQRLLCVAEGKVAAVGGGGGAALVQGAIAEGAVDHHGCVALELVADGRDGVADGVGADVVTFQ